MKICISLSQLKCWDKKIKTMCRKRYIVRHCVVFLIPLEMRLMSLLPFDKPRSFYPNSLHPISWLDFKFSMFPKDIINLPRIIASALVCYLCGMSGYLITALILL